MRNEFLINIMNPLLLALEFETQEMEPARSAVPVKAEKQFFSL